MIYVVLANSLSLFSINKYAGISRWSSTLWRDCFDVLEPVGSNNPRPALFIGEVFGRRNNTRITSKTRPTGYRSKTPSSLKSARESLGAHISHELLRESLHTLTGDDKLANLLLPN